MKLLSGPTGWYIETALEELHYFKKGVVIVRIAHGYLDSKSSPPNRFWQRYLEGWKGRM